MAILRVKQKIKKPHENIMGKHMKHEILANADKANSNIVTKYTDQTNTYRAFRKYHIFWGQ
jgi:hypothetical protein